MSLEQTAAPAQETPKAEAAPTTTFEQEKPQAIAAVEEPKAESKETETQVKPADANVVPEKYDFKMPEKSFLTAAQVDALASYAKEQKLTSAQAQALLERENGAVATYVETQQQELAKKPDAWLAEVKADKELGGAEFDKSTELAKRVVARFGSDAFKKVLNDTGLGNHPELVRVFARLGKAMSEDTLVLPGAQSGGKKSVEELFYPGASE